MKPISADRTYLLCSMVERFTKEYRNYYNEEFGKTLKGLL